MAPETRGRHCAACAKTTGGGGEDVAHDKQPVVGPGTEPVTVTDTGGDVASLLLYPDPSARAATLTLSEAGDAAPVNVYAADARLGLSRVTSEASVALESPIREASGSYAVEPLHFPPRYSSSSHSPRANTSPFLS